MRPDGRICDKVVALALTRERGEMVAQISPLPPGNDRLPLMTLTGLANHVGVNRAVIRRLLREGKISKDRMMDNGGTSPEDESPIRLQPLFTIFRAVQVQEILAAEAAGHEVPTEAQRAGQPAETVEGK